MVQGMEWPETNHYIPSPCLSANMPEFGHLSPPCELCNTTLEPTNPKRSMQMKTRPLARSSRRAFSVGCVFTVALLLSGCGTRGGLAQSWTTDQPKYAYLDYNTYYLYQDSLNYYHFSTVVSGSTGDGFWQQAEELDMAVDAYIWASANDTADAPAYKTEILNLANGFRHHSGDDWSGDKWNDDLNVAIIAFARAYHEDWSFNPPDRCRKQFQHRLEPGAARQRRHLRS